MVLLRLGWLTVLSSMNMVEQELYFLVRSPGDICDRSARERHKMIEHGWIERWTERWIDGVSHLHDSCSYFSFSHALK